ncbi:MAG: hypothetical protein AB7V13_27085, partial [Pseudorhodoplanes sp.]
DHYIQKPAHSPAEDQLFTELALRLIEVVDRATCAAVAERLRNHPGAPNAVLERLSQVVPPSVGSSVSGSIELFVTETSLDDDLGIFEPALPIAPEPLPATDLPAASATPPVDYVLQREAFFSATSSERRLILVNLVHVADQDMTPAQETSITRYLEQAALAGRAQEFTTLLQQALGLSRAASRRIVTDPLGEPFVVAARALAMPTEVFQRILMSLNPAIGQSVDRVFDLSDLFRDLPPPSALHLVAIFRAADRMDARTIVHRRVHWDDASPAGHRPTASEPRRISDGVQPAEPHRRETSRG